MEMEDFLPPGFRFFPTEEELVVFYLPNKIEPRRDDLSRLIDRVIPVLDIYEFNPWDLPQLSGELCRADPEQWFFFIPRQESEARGGRPRRLTTSGYWKATGSPGHVYSSQNNRVVGLKRTMVFYSGRAPTGVKTEWKMNEYKAIEGEASSSAATATPKLRQEFSLCRVYKKSKSLRAFDRRPQVAPMIVQPAPDQGPTNHGGGGGDPMVMASCPQVRTTSADSSSSGDDDHDNPPSQAGESSSAMELFLDWDQLNSFYDDP